MSDVVIGADFGRGPDRAVSILFCPRAGMVDPAAFKVVATKFRSAMGSVRAALPLPGPALQPMIRQMALVREQARDVNRLAAIEIGRACDQARLREAHESAVLSYIGATEARRNEPLRRAALSWFVAS